MRLVVLLLLCGTIAGNNDTVSNVIPLDERIGAVEGDEATGPAMNRTLSETFSDAVHAYLEENWERCVEDFNAVLHGYKMYKRMVTNCREKCRAKAAGSYPLFPENIEDLHFYERKVKETLCLLSCNQEYRDVAGSKILKLLSRDIQQKLVERRPYEYLHICYYQKKRYQDAANAVFTFLVRHPNHKPSIDNLKYYLTQPDVDEGNVLNLESPPYVTLYFKGVSAYNNEDYKEAAGLFEASIRSYLESEEECRFYCEGPFDQGWHPEFTSSIANHFAYCLKCKRSCSHYLNNINGDYREDMLKSHYNYLQFSYYKLGKLKAACAAVESYLVFDSTDETMLKNKEYYSAQPTVKGEYFAPRQEALMYVKRQEYEITLLRYISDEFNEIDAKVLKIYKNSEEKKKGKARELGKKSLPTMSLHPPPGHSLLPGAKLAGNISAIREDGYGTRDTTRHGVKDDVYLVAEAMELGGENRYVADGFLNSNDCESLMSLASMTAVEGDGYMENKSPHSKFERFEGITIGRAALMVYFGQIESSLLELLIDKTEQARGHVESYFGLDRPLYFSYTHLVCRTALPDSPNDRNDLSHQVHADNCLLLDNNTCLRESPAYTWRDYSAILYLNNDFRGGEFFFANDRTGGEPQGTVFPRCGRMVAFSAGGANLHGVRGVLGGRRCALALWFTQDERYFEYERIVAWAVLERVRSVGPFDGKDIRVPLRYEDLLAEHANGDDFLRNFLANSW